MQMHFSSPKSNFHPAAYEYHTDLGAFGTGSMYIEDVPGLGPYYRSFPLAKTCYSVNKRGRIDSAYREYTYTANTLRTFNAVYSNAITKNSDKNIPYNNSNYWIFN